jgi:hypothetical protein
MSTTAEIDLGLFCVGNTDRIQFTLNKDSVGWAPIDSVVVTFERPDATLFARDMVNLSGEVWYYDTTTSDLDQRGVWRAAVVVTQGNVVKKYPYEIILTVTDRP